MPIDWAKYGYIPLSIKDESVRAIVSRCFPNYRGRKIKARITTYPVNVHSYWEGGSRSYFVAINLRTMQTMQVPQNGTPFDKETPTEWSQHGVLPPTGFAIVEHSTFCGKDTGITIHVNAETAPKMLPPGGN